MFKTPNEMSAGADIPPIMINWLISCELLTLGENIETNVETKTDNVDKKKMSTTSNNAFFGLPKETKPSEPGNMIDETYNDKRVIIDEIIEIVETISNLV